MKFLLEYRRWAAAAIVLGAMGMASVAQADELPDWLQGPLKKPINQITIGVTQRFVGNSSYTSIYQDAFLAEAKALGVKVVYLDAQNDAMRQWAQVQDLMTEKVDVIVVWNVQAKLIVPSLRVAYKAHIPVLTANSRVDPSGEQYTVAFTGPDDYSQARLAAENLIKCMGGKGNVVGLEGNPGNGTSIARQKGFLDAVKSHPAIKLLDDQPYDWDLAKAQNLMEAYITRFGGKIDGVFGADDNGSMGALSTIRAAVSQGKIKPHSIELTSATLYNSGYEAIAQGDYCGAVMQSPIDDGKNALKVAVQIAEGRPVPKTVTLNAPFVGRDNYKEYPAPGF
ncbi:sugar ABC transporter substrate-binding protein [Paraburkholderia sp. J12]|uniref:sugar ABC transporter substrate-binding protein n=1 Tax=Paraburkholderia sp. J12 TaxID=2805432 RepID=UPI002ABDD04F|nr:sugar ABC transporter substrate-binding protein [Paraburkholderia sp. J12]